MLTAAHAQDMATAEMIQQIAFGMEPPEDVAFRFGFTAQQYQILAQQEWFANAVSERVASLKADGWTFKQKARMMAEDLLQDVYLAAKKSNSHDFTLEATKYITKLAELEPKAGAQAATGPAFSISINVAGSGPQQVNVTPIAQDPVLDAVPTYITLPFTPLPTLDASS